MSESRFFDFVIRISAPVIGILFFLSWIDEPLGNIFTESDMEGFFTFMFDNLLVVTVLALAIYFYYKKRIDLKYYIPIVIIITLAVHFFL